MMKMDLREAKACLDEYRSWLDTTGKMLRSDTVEGEFRENIEKLNDSLIAALDVYRREALVLSTLIWGELIARKDEMLDFPDEWAELIAALNALKLATDNSASIRGEHVAKIKAVQEQTQALSPSALAIREFRRRHGMMKEEREAYDRNEGLKSPS